MDTLCLQVKYLLLHLEIGHAAGGAVGLGTALQAAKLRVRFRMVLMEFFIDITLCLIVALGSTQPLKEMSTRNISWG